MTTSADKYDALLLDCRPRPIRSKRQYRSALRRIETLMRDSSPGMAESEMIELLSTLVKQYEECEQPTPAGNPVELLEHLIESRGLTRAQLARESGIARSVITNIMSGRRAVSVANAHRLSTMFGIRIENFLDVGGRAH